MVVRLPVVVAKVKATGAGLGLWQVPSQCVAVLQRTLDARLVHHYHYRRRHHHLFLNPMTRMKMRTKMETEMALRLVVLAGAPP
jgi:hypothetical protein